MESAIEFSRPVDLRALPRQQVELVANKTERAALARRFGIVAIGALKASATLEEGAAGVDVTGRITAELVQSCAISGDDFPVRVSSQYRLRFVPEADYEAAMQAAGDEVELAESDLDTIAYSGSTLDLGEAIAQTLALEIDPYAEGPGAEAARAQYGLSTPEENGPFAALKALKDKQG
ncbi:YceD family protein [Blastomonas sp.]|uniref:YceD family protein n=1 Tax=Blastomonas sp. TaxID=1909299 RepID=UPI00391B3CC5